MENIVEDNLAEIAVDCQLTMADDKMQVFFSCPATFAMTEQAIEAIRLKLEKMKIAGAPDLELIKNVLEERNSPAEGISDLVIIRGIPPQPSVDAQLEWTADYFADSCRIDPESKRIDFQEKHAEAAVEKDALLVKLIPGQAGVEGRDVLGKILPVGKPRDVDIKPGPHVYWDKETGGYRARCSGRVRLRGRVLDVDEILVVRGGVETASGNIHHKGKIIVDGDVDKNFLVEATGDIDVSGVIYASDIKCGGNLMAKGGINGDEGRKIIVTENMQAKYIMNSSVESSGNILVKQEIVQTKIVTSGEVICNEGRIIGGEIMATRGIQVAEAGSKSVTPTSLIAGVDNKLQNGLQTNSAEINRLKDAIKKLNEVYRRFKANLSILNHDQREKMTEIQFKVIEAEEEIGRLEALNKTIYAKILENSGARITIHEIVYPGVALRICDKQYLIEDALAGPIVVLFDRARHEVVLKTEPENEARSNQ